MDLTSFTECNFESITSYDNKNSFNVKFNTQNKL